MSSTPAAAPKPPEDETRLAEAPEVAPQQSFTESILDNLPAWTVVAAAISVLYLVWVTLSILDKYVGLLPKVGP